MTLEETYLEEGVPIEVLKRFRSQFRGKKWQSEAQRARAYSNLEASRIKNEKAAKKAAQQIALEQKKILDSMIAETLADLKKGLRATIKEIIAEELGVDPL